MAIAPVVFHDQQHPLLGVKGDGAGEVDDEGGMGPGMEMRAFRGAATSDLPGHIEDLFSRPAITSVSPRKVRVRVGYLVVRIEVVFQISVRQRQGIEGKHILHFFKGFDPARRFMLKIFFGLL